MDKKYIIGIGTGRSGTTSLARLLDNCENVHVTHEDMPALAWHKRDLHVEQAMSYWDALQWPRNCTHVGDVAAWHLNYIPNYIEQLGDVQVIAVWREEDKVVRSWLKVLQWKGFLLQNDTPGQRMWPTFDCDPETAVRRYWRIYNHRVNKLVGRFPDRVHRCHVDHLNTKWGQSRLMSLAGIPKPQRRLSDDTKRNVSGATTQKQRRNQHRIRQAEQL